MFNIIRKQEQFEEKEIKKNIELNQGIIEEIKAINQKNKKLIDELRREEKTELEKRITDFKKEMIDIYETIMMHKLEEEKTGKEKPLIITTQKEETNLIERLITREKEAYQEIRRIEELKRTSKILERRKIINDEEKKTLNLIIDEVLNKTHEHSGYVNNEFSTDIIRPDKIELNNIYNRLISKEPTKRFFGGEKLWRINDFYNYTIKYLTTLDQEANKGETRLSEDDLHALIKIREKLEERREKSERWKPYKEHSQYLLRESQYRITKGLLEELIRKAKENNHLEEYHYPETGDNLILDYEEARKEREAREIARRIRKANNDEETIIKIRKKGRKYYYDSKAIARAIINKDREIIVQAIKQLEPEFERIRNLEIKLSNPEEEKIMIYNAYKLVHDLKKHEEEISIENVIEVYQKQYEKVIDMNDARKIIETMIKGEERKKTTEIREYLRNKISKQYQVIKEAIIKTEKNESYYKTDIRIKDKEIIKYKKAA